ncbi:MAG: hypothetical protein PHQ40_02265 [Anaerolineaceae bacterium]|nr:hypothetical protein [Anaerolineaceae bacterium]
MINRENYTLVKTHLTYLEEVGQLSPSSVERYWFYLRHLLLWADDRVLGKAATLRPTFPAYVASQPARRGEGNLAAESQKKIVETAKRFFQWAKTNYPKSYREMPSSWIDLLRPPRLPQPSDEHEYVTVDDVTRLATRIDSAEDLAMKRDQAAAAMLFLSGMRANAFVTLPISAVDLPSRSVRQWPELGVKTKNGKRATTYLLPIPDLLTVVEEWDALVRSSLPPTSRWYAPIESCWGDQIFSSAEPGENRNHALDKRLKLLYGRANLPYHSAHKFRHGHAVYGLQHAQTMADYKALSLNLMHQDIKITDQIYAPILNDEVKQRVAGMSNLPADQPDDDLGSYFNSLSNAQLSKAMAIIADRLIR